MDSPSRACDEFIRRKVSMRERRLHGARQSLPGQSVVGIAFSQKRENARGPNE
jgi:hypothetical protein